MKKLFPVFFFGILFMFLMGVSLTSAISFCIDHIPPSAPSNLSAMGKVGSIVLTWLPATDSPSCSGIAEYKISRAGNEIGVVNGTTLSFTDANESLGVGTYHYTVFAVDMAGHNTGKAIIISVAIKKGNNGNFVYKSGVGHICVANWSCGNWSECVNHEQAQVCEDLNQCGYNKTNDIVTRKKCGINNANNNQSVTLSPETKQSETSSRGFFSALTGAVVGVINKTGKTTFTIFISLILLVLIIATGIILNKRFNK